MHCGVLQKCLTAPLQMPDIDDRTCRDKMWTPNICCINLMQEKASAAFSEILDTQTFKQIDKE